MGLLERLKVGLEKTRKVLLSDVNEVFLGKKVVDQELFDELEEVLIAADVGPVYTAQLLEKMQAQVKRNELNSPDALKKIIRETMAETLKKSDAPFFIPGESLFTIMVVGVNGTGKTTTIGKLAHLFREEGRTVTLAAADTFRAAAIEQLAVWSERAGVHLVKQKINSDPSAVIFDAIQAARRRSEGVLIVDTAGRLHTRVNLMEELKKMKRIMAREITGAPHEIWLVLDATTGQNAISQAKIFSEEAGITGIILTKLDGTAKGGVLAAIAQERPVPVYFIGVGEKLEDLETFNAAEFAQALLS